MLITVGGKKFRMNWKHEVVRNKVDEWYAKHGGELKNLAPSAKHTLQNLLAMVAPWTAENRRRNGFTTCFVEAVDGDLRFEGRVECSLLDPYSKEDGRQRTMKQTWWPMAQALGMSYAEVKEAVEQQYADRMKKAA